MVRFRPCGTRPTVVTETNPYTQMRGRVLEVSKSLAAVVSEDAFLFCHTAGLSSLSSGTLLAKVVCPLQPRKSSSI